MSEKTALMARVANLRGQIKQSEQRHFVDGGIVLAGAAIGGALDGALIARDMAPAAGMVGVALAAGGYIMESPGAFLLAVGMLSDYAKSAGGSIGASLFAKTPAK